MQNEQNYILSLIGANKAHASSNYKADTVLDWNYILEICHKHKLLSVLYNITKNDSTIPEHVLDFLSNEHFIWTHRSATQQREFLAILEQLNNQGIKVILLKGVYLAEKCYPDLSERPYWDMDILVEKEDVKKVFDVFTRMGYIQGSYDDQKKEVKKFDSSRLVGYETELQHYGEFVKVSNSEFLECFYVDVHYRLSTIFDNFSYNIDELFSRSIKDDIIGIPFYRLDNEDFVLHLASHLYWHTLSIRDIINERDIVLLMYYDISLFIKKYSINWEKLLKRANEYELNNAVYYTLYHCQILFGNTVPDYIFQSWDENKLKEISNTIYDRWFTRDTLTPVGKWKKEFIERTFDENRKNEALLSFYNDYINKIIFQGSYFKIVDINSTDRFNN